MFALLDLLFVADDQAFLLVGFVLEFSLHFEDLFLGFEDSVPLQVFGSNFSLFNNQLGFCIGILFALLKLFLRKKRSEQQAQHDCSISH